MSESITTQARRNGKLVDPEEMNAPLAEDTIDESPEAEFAPPPPAKGKRGRPKAVPAPEPAPEAIEEDLEDEEPAPAPVAAKTSSYSADSDAQRGVITLMKNGVPIGEAELFTHDARTVEMFDGYESLKAPATAALRKWEIEATRLNQRDLNADELVRAALKLQDPDLGDKTPRFIEHLRKTLSPAEFARRFSGRKVKHLGIDKC